MVNKRYISSIFEHEKILYEKTSHNTSVDKIKSKKLHTDDLLQINFCFSMKLSRIIGNKANIVD